MNDSSEKKRFSIVKRAQSFTHAFRGLRIFMASTHNAWIHCALTLIVVYMGVHFSITSTEWALIIFAIGLVFVAEAFNTAMEIDINLTSPDFHPYARDTKDMAAGAVLIATITSIIIGLIVFAPYIYSLINTQ